MAGCSRQRNWTIWSGYSMACRWSPRDSRVGNGGIRTTQVAWVYRNAQTEDLYLRMEAIVLRLNADLFHFELTGLTTMQYAVYRHEEAGYFDWHNDYGRYRGDPGQEPRKITLSLQLSDGALTTAATWKCAPPIPSMSRRASAAP